MVSETIDINLLTPEILIDAQIDLADISPKLMRILKQFAPFGPGNLSPVFMTDNLKDTGYAKGVGQDDKHLKLTATQYGNGPIGGIGFNLGDKLQIVANQQSFSAVYSLDENEWQGNVSLQLKLRDLH